MNETSRLTKKVEPPGRVKCQPSSCGATYPAQLPVEVKFAAVIGGGVFGSSWIWYELPLAAADPVAAVASTAPTATMPAAPTTAASRHPVTRALLLNTGSSLGRPSCGAYLMSLTTLHLRCTPYRRKQIEALDRRLL